MMDDKITLPYLSKLESLLELTTKAVSAIWWKQNVFERHNVPGSNNVWKAMFNTMVKVKVTR